MRQLICSGAFFTFLLGNSVAASSSLFDPESISGWIDLRVATSDAGREWLDGGRSKTRYGHVTDDRLDGEIAEVGLLWRPTFSFSFSGHLHLQAGPDQEMPISAVEAYAIYRAPPTGPTRISGRAGRFYLPVSLEHDGEGWGLTRTLTPSAINSWIGEEVPVIGLEAKSTRVFGEHLLELRGATFGFNDTAGSLLGFRGWAMHDLKSVIGGSLQLPDSDGRRSLVPLQDERTRPTKEIDRRAGYYGGVKWRYSDLFELSLLGYDNAGNPEALINGQYAWDTRFFNGGVVLWPGSDLEILAQGMIGESLMGGMSEGIRGPRMYDFEFSSAYLLASARQDSHVYSARFDVFGIRDRNEFTYDRGENGWAMTMAWLYEAAKGVQTGAEILYVKNGRNMNTSVFQSDAVQIQGSVRFRF